ncbi:supporter of activation of yellow protein-like [Ctenocephalides felis]|uniref:supporter of activation of yellow protein-like n=1 Tax=Ctenocephalides felis TaxID=7515 RepID=UPI000E6E3AF5|nr:supporter of activation of yellow protein-like [Ctenocephalides felis]
MNKLPLDDDMPESCQEIYDCETAVLNKDLEVVEETPEIEESTVTIIDSINDAVITEAPEIDESLPEAIETVVSSKDLEIVEQTLEIEESSVTITDFMIDAEMTEAPEIDESSPAIETIETEQVTHIKDDSVSILANEEPKSLPADEELTLKMVSKTEEMAIETNKQIIDDIECEQTVNNPESIENVVSEATDILEVESLVKQAEVHEPVNTDLIENVEVEETVVESENFKLNDDIISNTTEIDHAQAATSIANNVNVLEVAETIDLNTLLVKDLEIELEETIKAEEMLKEVELTEEPVKDIEVSDNNEEESEKSISIEKLSEDILTSDQITTGLEEDTENAELIKPAETVDILMETEVVESMETVETTDETKDALAVDDVKEKIITESSLDVPVSEDSEDKSNKLDTDIQEAITNEMPEQLMEVSEETSIDTDVSDATSTVTPSTIKSNKSNKPVLIKCSNLLDESLQSESSILDTSVIADTTIENDSDEVDKVETKIDDRKVGPLKLNLSQKPNLKRPAESDSLSIITKIQKLAESGLTENRECVKTDKTPKVTIKPIRKPVDEESNIPKLTIKPVVDTEKQKEEGKPPLIDKVETVPKLTIKPIVKPEAEIVPKLTLKIPIDNKDPSSESDSDEVKSSKNIVPKLTLKLPVEVSSKEVTSESETDECKMSDEAHTVPKLMLKIQHKPEETNADQVSSTQTIPKLTIRTSEKSAEVISKLIVNVNQQATSSTDDVVQQKVPKLTLRLNPEDQSIADSTGQLSKETSESEYEDELVQHTVPPLTIKLSSDKEQDKLIEKESIHQTVPKLMIKLPADKEQLSVKNSDVQQTVPKITIKLPSEKDADDNKDVSIKTFEKTTEEKTTHLIVPKLTIKKSSEKDQDDQDKPIEKHVVPKLTIKSVPKPETETVPKLTVKLSSTGEHHIENTHNNEAVRSTAKIGAFDSVHLTPKVTIKPVVKSEQEVHPKVTISPKKKEVPKLTLKLSSDVSLDIKTDAHHSKDMPKFNIKPIPSVQTEADPTKPLEIVTTDKHPHIVHGEQDVNTASMKRALMNPDLDIIEVKRPCVDSIYSRLPPDVSISPIKQQQASPTVKQTEKQKSEKRLRDILSKLHQKSTEQPRQDSPLPLQRVLIDEAHDNSSSSGLIFGKDIELIRMGESMAQNVVSPTVTTPNRGTMPRKRGRPRKDANLIAQKKEQLAQEMLQNSLFPAQHMLEGLMTGSGESPVRTSRRSTRGRERYDFYHTKGRGRGRGSKQQALQVSMEQQRIQQMLNIQDQIIQQQASGDNAQVALKSPESWQSQNQQSGNLESFQDKIKSLTKQHQEMVSNSDPLQNLQAMTSNIPIDLTGADDSSDAVIPSTPNQVTTPQDSQKEMVENMDTSILSPEGISPSSIMKTPGSTRAPTRGRRGRGSRGSRGSPKKRGSSLKENPLPMFEEDTRMSADLGNKSTPGMPIKSGVGEGADESQSSMHSSANENSKSKRGRMEVGDSEGKLEFTVDMIAEYLWPQPEVASPTSTATVNQNNNTNSVSNNTSTTTNGTSNSYEEKLFPEMYMIQEQIALYLGVTSFKRKYPDVRRRQVEMRERDYIMSRNLVTETLCDLGLTAIPTCEVLDIMSADFPQKYDEYKKYLRDKQAKELAIKQRAMNNDRNKQRSIKDRAISSASSWNSKFNKDRMENRKGGCLDLQTYVIQKSKSVRRVQSPSKTKPGHYPVALVPGQFCDYYKKYSPNELRYFPLDTVLYGPQKPNQQTLPIVVNQGSDSSSSSSSSSGSDSDSSSDDSEDEDGPSNSDRSCRLCKVSKPGQEFVQCTGCKAHVHALCAGLRSRESILLSKSYAWRCMECKQCLQCSKPIQAAANGDNSLSNGLNSNQKSPNVLRCERCDRCAHVACIGNGSNSSSSKWSCTLCSTCDSCKSPDSGITNNSTNATSIKQWRRVDTPRGPRQLCQPCAVMWQEKRYCSMCYLCVLDNQAFMTCKICTHKMHTGCIRTQFPNMTGNEIVTCLECSKKPQNFPKVVSNSINLTHHQQQIVTTTC